MLYGAADGEPGRVVAGRWLDKVRTGNDSPAVK